MDERTAAILDVTRDLPQHEVSVPLRSPRGLATRTFAGALLWDYARAIGLRPTPTPIGFGNHYVVATAEDGFRVTLGYFEVTPRATEKQVLLADQQDGEPLRAGVRLVVPGDDLGGRSIAGVIGIELRQAPPVADGLPATGGVTLTGSLERPRTLAASEVRQRGAHVIETLPTPRHGGEVAEPRRYGGPLLWDLLDEAGPVLDPAIREDVLRKIVVVRSVDGQTAVLAAGELEPRFMGGRVVLACTRDGEPLNDDEGPFRLLVPYDRVVGRALKRVCSIEWLDS